MKRRKFFKTAVIGAGAIALAPTLALGQDPLASIRQYYYNWYIAPRDYDVHIPNNYYYWHLASKCAKSEPIKAREGWMKSGGGVIQSGHQYPICQKTHIVNFSDYDHVYQLQTNKNLFWMNVEDYVFYEELKRDAILNYNQTRLLFIGYVPGLINPFCPHETFYVSPQLKFVPPNGIKKTYPTDDYEIRVTYQKLW